MNEEKKVLLSDEDLEQVNGGDFSPGYNDEIKTDEEDRRFIKSKATFDFWPPERSFTRESTKSPKSIFSTIFNSSLSKFAIS